MTATRMIEPWELDTIHERLPRQPSPREYKPEFIPGDWIIANVVVTPLPLYNQDERDPLPVMSLTIGRIP